MSYDVPFARIGEGKVVKQWKNKKKEEEET